MQEQEHVDEPDPEPAVPAHLLEARAQLGQEARAAARRRRADAERPQAGRADRRTCRRRARRRRPVETGSREMPPSAAPKPNAMLRVMPSSALACCRRSCGVTCGTSAVEARHEERRGRGVQPYEHDQAARCAPRPLSRSDRRDRLDEGPRARSAASMIVRRGSRSAQTPPTSRNTVWGRSPRDQDECRGRSASRRGRAPRRRARSRCRRRPARPPGPRRRARTRARAAPPGSSRSLTARA